MTENWKGSLYCFHLDMQYKLSTNVNEKGEPTKEEARNFSQRYLEDKLQEHLAAGNFVDVANFAFLMYQRKMGLASKNNNKTEGKTQ